MALTDLKVPQKNFWPFESNHFQACEGAREFLFLKYLLNELKNS